MIFSSVRIKRLLGTYRRGIRAVAPAFLAPRTGPASSSVASAPRAANNLMALLMSFSMAACAHQPFVTNDGSKSDGSKSDGSKSEGSKSEGSKTDGPDGSGSNSDTSGSGTSGDGDGSSVGLYILTGALLLGATTIVGIVLMNNAEPVAYTTRHERGIRLALARGEGPFVLDVADNLRLPRTLLPTLGRALRASRKTLEVHLVATDADGLSRESGRRFAEGLVRALQTEPTLLPYVDRLMDEVAVLMGPQPAVLMGPQPAR